MGSHPAAQTAVVFQEAEERVTAKEGRPVGTFLTLTSFPKLDTQGAKERLSTHWSSPQGESKHLPTQPWAHTLSPVHAGRHRPLRLLLTVWTHEGLVLLRVLSPPWLLPLFSFYLRVCEIPLEGTGAYARTRTSGYTRHLCSPQSLPRTLPSVDWAPVSCLHLAPSGPEPVMASRSPILGPWPSFVVPFTLPMPLSRGPSKIYFT